MAILVPLHKFLGDGAICPFLVFTDESGGGILQPYLEQLFKVRNGGMRMLRKDRDLMARIRRFAEEYALKNGVKTPSMAAIAAEFGICRSGAYGYLKEMDRLKMIRYEGGVIHTEVTDRVTVPAQLCRGYSEGISAGSPGEAEGAADSYFPIPPVFTDGRKGDFFTLKVSGDSMVDAGIGNGDIVICRAGERPRDNDVVAAYIRGSGSTLKRFRRDEKGPFLWAENKSWSIDDRMFGRVFDVQGVAIKVIKDIL